jgi:hypothetical protein
VSDVRLSGPPLAIQVEGKGRLYEHPVTKELYPSITACIGVLDKPALVGWAAKETAKAAFQQRAALALMTDEEAAVDMLKNARYRRTERAASVGSTVHAVCEALARDEDLPTFDDQHAPFIDQFLKFVSEYGVEFTHVEATVFSDEYRYSGTLDMIGRIGGWLVLGDYKTGGDPTQGKGIYPEVALQLAAARYAESVWDRLSGELHPMPAVDGCIAIHLGRDGFNIHLIAAGEKAFRAFVAARGLWPWHVGGESKGVIGPVMSPQRLIKAIEIERPSPQLEVL